MNRKQLLGIGVVLVLLVGANEAKMASRLAGMGQRIHPHPPPLSEAERKAMYERARQFSQLWVARHERAVAKDMLPYLKDPYWGLRISAVRALGRLENPVAEEPLRALLQDEKLLEEPYDRLPTIAALALARIRARDRHGWAKIDAVAGGVNLTRRELLELARRSVREGWGSPTRGGTIHNEIVDVVYTMGKRGEDIEDIAAALAVTPPQAVKLQGATLSTREEIQLVVDYLAKETILTGDHLKLSSLHLTGLGPLVGPILRERLEDEIRNPGKCTANGLVALLRAASSVCDAQWLPLFEQLEHHPKYGKIKNTLGVARRRLRSGTNYVPGP